jgi:hypothetical protein
VHVALRTDFGQSHELIVRFRVERCVIDGMPETRPTWGVYQYYRKAAAGIRAKRAG